MAVAGGEVEVEVEELVVSRMEEAPQQGMAVIMEEATTTKGLLRKALTETSQCLAYRRIRTVPMDRCLLQQATGRDRASMGWNIREGVRQ